MTGFSNTQTLLRGGKNLFRAGSRAARERAAHDEIKRAAHDPPTLDRPYADRSWEVSSGGKTPAEIQSATSG
jgi:hypothetical protein